MNKILKGLILLPVLLLSFSVVSATELDKPLNCCILRSDVKLDGETYICITDYVSEGTTKGDKIIYSYYCDVTETKPWYGGTKKTKTLYRDKCASICNGKTKRCSDNSGSTNTVSIDTGGSNTDTTTTSTGPKYYEPYSIDSNSKTGICTFNDDAGKSSTMIDKTYICVENNLNIRHSGITSTSYYCDGNFIYSRTCPDGSWCSTGGKYIGQCVVKAVPNGYSRMGSVDVVNGLCNTFPLVNALPNMEINKYKCTDKGSYYCASSGVLSKKDCDFG